jgi:hypothetical protein
MEEILRTKEAGEERAMKSQKEKDKAEAMVHKMQDVVQKL